MFSQSQSYARCSALSLAVATPFCCRRRLCCRYSFCRCTLFIVAIPFIIESSNTTSPLCPLAWNCASAATVSLRAESALIDLDVIFANDSSAAALILGSLEVKLFW